MNDEAISAVHFFQRENGLYPVSAEVIAAACAHAAENITMESCGIVYAGQYHPIPNSAKNPGNEFEIALKDQLAVCTPELVEAVIHSHPNGLVGPTVSDMVSQFSSNVPFGVISLERDYIKDVLFYGADTPIAPLKGRPFVSGVYDCYGTVRDKFRRDYGITLHDYPRDPDWWTSLDDKNMLLDNFEEAGFSVISEEEVREGDCFLSKPFRIPKICHCGVYVGNGVVLHHFGTPNSQRLSCEESLYTVRETITHWLRHKDGPVQPSANTEE